MAINSVRRRRPKRRNVSRSSQEVRLARVKGEGLAGRAARCGNSLSAVPMSEQRLTRIVIVTNPQGLHARPADMFVKTAMRFQSKIEVVKDSERVDGKSILSMLTLAAMEGTKLSLEATGGDAQQALDALAELFLRNFADEQEKAEAQP